MGFPFLVAWQLAKGLRRTYKAVTADSCLPHQPHGELGTIAGMYPVLYNLSACLDICYSFYLFSATIFYLFILTHPLKLSLDEPSFTKTALKTAFNSISNQALPHSLFCFFTGPCAPSQDNDYYMAHSRCQQTVK